MVTSMVNGYEEALFKPTHGTNLQNGIFHWQDPILHSSIHYRCIQTGLDGGGAAVFAVV